LKTVEYIEENNYGRAVYHLFVVKCRRRDALAEYLKKNGIGALIHYSLPMNKQSVFPEQREEKFSSSEKFTAEILSLPLYPEMTDEEAAYVVEIVNNF
jgi:dTDP-4-amino-4,6-dideoxygalactose transaminase